MDGINRQHVNGDFDMSEHVHDEVVSLEKLKQQLDRIVGIRMNQLEIDPNKPSAINDLIIALGISGHAFLENYRRGEKVIDRLRRKHRSDIIPLKDIDLSDAKDLDSFETSPLGGQTGLDFIVTNAESIVLGVKERVKARLLGKAS